MAEVTGDGGKALQDPAVLRELFNRISEAIYISTPDGHIVDGNPALAAVFRAASVDELRQHPIPDLLVHPERRAEELRVLGQRGWVRAYELGIRRLDGSVGTVIDTCYARSDEAGRVQEYHGILRDISERKQVEADLEVGLARFHCLIENLPAGVLFESEERVIVAVNTEFCRTFALEAGPEDLLGRDGSAAAERSKSLLVDPDRFPARLQEVVEARRVVLGEEVRFADGRVFERDYIPVLAADGRSFGHAWQYWDVTERRRTAEELRKREEWLHQAQKMDAVGRLAGGIAHDYNNLLTAISGFAELALSKVEPDGAVASDVRNIKSAGDRAVSLTAQLLSFSRGQVLAPRQLDLRSIMASMDGMIRPLLGENIELMYQPEEVLRAVEADAVKLEQMFLYLLVNARDSMPRGGRLTVRVRNVTLHEDLVTCGSLVPAGDYVVLSVADSGPGMSEETRQHVFEPFYTSKELGPRSGLGLSTVYGIVRQSAGHIVVESELGKGSAFTVYLPAVEGGVPRRDPARSPAPFPRGSETILLVEDEAAVRALTARVLRDQGYSVLEAGHPEEALGLVGRWPAVPHLLLTDVVMPRMSGPELAARIRERFPGIRVLYMSGYADDAVVRHGVRLDEKTFLPKPFDARQLAGKVRRVLDTAPPSQERPPLGSPGSEES